MSATNDMMDGVMSMNDDKATTLKKEIKETEAKIKTLDKQQASLQKAFELKTKEGDYKEVVKLTKTKNLHTDKLNKAKAHLKKLNDKLAATKAKDLKDNASDSKAETKTVAGLFDQVTDATSSLMDVSVKSESERKQSELEEKLDKIQKEQKKLTKQNGEILEALKEAKTDDQ